MNNNISSNKTIIIVAAVFVFSISILPQLADSQEQAKATQPAPATPAPAPAAPKVNEITQAAVNAGVLSCASRINQISSFLTAGGQSGAFLFMPESAADQKLFSTSLEVQPVGVPLAYASASYAPTSPGNCSGVYDAITYWEKECREVASTNFTGLKKQGYIASKIEVYDGGPNTRIFLMPAGKGCISIKKEVVQ